MLKRFAVVGDMDYYPCGGFVDIKAAFHTREEAQEWLDKQIDAGNWHYDNTEIVDIHTTVLWDGVQEEY